MNHSKIIFLDFDGVLNTEHHQRQLLYDMKGKRGKTNMELVLTQKP